MNVTHQVEVLGAERLRSELANFVWTQSQIQSERRLASGGPAREEVNFHSSKADLYAGVLALAGSKLRMDELVDQLAKLIAVGPNEEINQLDPHLMAGRISSRAN